MRDDGPDAFRAREITTRGLALRADSIDEQTRSVEAVFSTEEPVEVFDWERWEVIDEVLRMDGAEWSEQVPMLANHRRWDLDDVLGSGRSITRSSGAITGRLHFAEGDETAERAWSKVKQKHLRDVSVGYRVRESTPIPPGQTKVVNGRKYTAGQRMLRISTRWQLKEISLVPIGADQLAKIRRDNPKPEEATTMPPELRTYLESLGLRNDATEATAWAFHASLGGAQLARAGELLNGVTPPADQRRHEEPPPVEDDRADGDRREDPPVPPPAGETEAIRAVRLERERIAEIRRRAASDVPVEMISRAIDEGWDLDRASTEFLAHVRQTRPAPVSASPAIHSHSREIDTNLRSLSAGLLSQLGFDPTQHSVRDDRGRSLRAHRLTEQDADRGDSFARLSAVDIVRECVRLDTGRYVRDYEDAIRAAVSGATLSYVFSTSVYAQLAAGFEEVGDTTTGWCEEEDVANFLTQEDISIEANARMQRLPRGDTAKHATMSDSRETYSIARYAKQFVVDEQDLLDDRLGAIMRMPFQMGQAARRLRPDLVYAKMLQNPTMADTGAVFNSTAVTTTGGHANLGTAALADASLKAGITAMVSQRMGRTSTDPGQQLTIRPRFLIVPAALEWTARGLTSAAALAKLFADSTDPYYSTLNQLAQEGLRVVIDDRIGAIGVMDPATEAARTGLDTNWWLTNGRGLRVVYRRGTGRAPQMRPFTLDRGQWGIGWDIKHDIGVVFTEWMTWYESTGAA